MSLLITVPTNQLRERIQPRLPQGATLEVWPMDGPSGLGHVDLAVLPYMSSPTLLDVLDGEDVAAVQSQALGYDKVDEHLPKGITYCNAVGVHEGSTAEVALALVLAAQRDIPRYVEERGQWSHVFSPGLLGRTVLLVGVGGIGEQIRQRLEPFDCTILRSATHARSDEHGDITGPEELPEQLGKADVVVLVTPLTAETEHLVDAAFLSHMQQGALLVNVGRGAVVDTDALVEAVRSGHVRAALDVVDPEPLPADHPLWELEGALVVPHIGGRTSTMEDRVVELVTGQVQRLAEGGELQHRVL